MFNVGDKVKKNTDGKIGVIQTIGPGSRYGVQFNQDPIVYLSESILDRFIENQTLQDYFNSLNFFGIDDYRRIMAFQRLNGELTNMYYSMSNTLTDYLPHQFLPVIKFLQSPEERLLIADEVGLGKTIEAMYVWKELEARRNAKRLLIICPAALKEKWQRDMRNLFGIKAEDVKAEKLLATFEQIERNKDKEQFAYICSIESIRTKDTIGGTTIKRLNQAFENFSNNTFDYAFDLTIIDEAHYLRNRDTANFKTGSRLRDISESLLLLSATPIQTSSSNLYSLMNLLAPERYDNENTFQHMLNQDTVFVRLANCLQQTDTTTDTFLSIVEQYAHKGYILDNPIIKEIIENIHEIVNSPEKRMLNSERLRSEVFYSNIYTRMRRRFVFTNTAKRDAHAVRFTFSAEERFIYQKVTKLVTEMAKDDSDIITFALISRQRQMASCLPAAFRAWKQKNKNSLSQAEEEEYELGEQQNDTEYSPKEIICNLQPFYSEIEKEFGGVEFEHLKKNDSKYAKFLESIKELLTINPKEKIIVFSFFRGTNEYLEERLREDKISVVAIKGGMGRIKDDVLDAFKKDETINILISSEVGSEGLDLQFASVEYNYDLPWNPMRLEQRIGRIDRIGQQADILRIYNLYCEDTIEDKILERLYERIDIFKNSIGDLESIVGQPIQELAVEILNPTLSDEDKERKAEQKIQAVVNQRIMSNKLEDEAELLNEYRDRILGSIEVAKQNKRCIETEEKIFIIKDFLQYFYPGSIFIQNKDKSRYYNIKLSEKAIVDFKEFRRTEHPNKHTNIDSSMNLSLTFDKLPKYPANVELVELDHPIFDWIKWKLKQESMQNYGCSAITIKGSDDIGKGDYVYYIQKWKKTGVEKGTELKYFIADVSTGAILCEDQCEQVLNSAINAGQNLINPEVYLDNFAPYHSMMYELINHAWDKYELYEKEYKNRSISIYKKQVDFISFTAEKKIVSIRDTIKKLSEENKNERIIHMNEKKIEKIEKERNIKLQILEKNKLSELELTEIALGILVVE